MAVPSVGGRGGPPVRASILVPLVLLLVGCGVKARRGRRRPSPTASDAAATSGLKAPLAVRILEVQDVTGASRHGTFYRGEKLRLTGAASGLDTCGPRAATYVSLVLVGPKGRVLWRKEQRVELPSRERSPRTLRFTLTLELSPAEPTGPHRLDLRVHQPDCDAQGTATLRFQVAGPRLTRTPRLSLHGLWASPGEDVLPGGLVPVTGWASGLAARDERPRAPAGAPRWRLRMAARARFLKRDGSTATEHEAWVVDDTMPFLPAAVPVRLDLPAPRSPGDYTLEIEFRDAVSGATTRARRALRIPPAGFGVYGLHVVGPTGTVEPSYGRLEPVTARMWVWSPKPIAARGDVALQGPDGGLYLRRLGAFRIPRERLARGRPVPVRIPFRIPEYAPRGRYRFHVRLTSPRAKETAERWFSFRVAGKALAPLPGLQILHTRIGARQGPLPILAIGRDVPFRIVVGGMKVEHEPPLSYHVSLQVNMLLRDLDGTLLLRDDHVLDFDRTYTFLPRRLVLQGSWRVPDGHTGVLLLQIEVLDLLSRRTSLSQRKVLVSPR